VVEFFLGLIFSSANNLKFNFVISQAGIMSLKLREMVRGIRSCKTLGDVKDLVQSEKAAIRESFTVRSFVCFA